MALILDTLTGLYFVMTVVGTALVVRLYGVMIAGTFAASIPVSPPKPSSSSCTRRPLSGASCSFSGRGREEARKPRLLGLDRDLLVPSSDFYPTPFFLPTRAPLLFHRLTPIVFNLLPAQRRQEKNDGRRNRTSH